MTMEKADPARQLAALLETLPPETRQEITAWLLGLGRPAASTALSASWPAAAAMHSLGGVASAGGAAAAAGGAAAAGAAASGAAERVRRLAATLPAGEDSQLVTIRLTAERHAELRDWCAQHGFTMAAVVRGLVERFLEERGSAGAPG